MSDLLKLSLDEITTKLKSKEVSATELAQTALDACRAAQPKLNAFTAFDADKTMAMAKASDEKLAKGEGGLLEGAPLAIKDLFAVEGVSTTASSNILKGFEPPYESTVTANLWGEGGIFLCKTSMDEFAMGSSNETANTGPVNNPWTGANGEMLTPGGSSGGSASAVAADLCYGSTGTDTGGSIRQPASFTGTVGVKGTYGRTSRWGAVAFASSLDHPGPFAKTVKDSAMLLQAMSGHDPKDSTSLPNAVPDFVAAASGQSIKGLKIGVPREYRVDGMPAEIEQAWQKGIEWLKAAGCEIVDISLPHTKYALPAYYIVAPAEASSNLARYDGMRFGVREDGKDLTEVYENTRASGFGHEVQRRILIGTYVLSAGYYDAYYIRAQKVRTRILQDFDEAFKTVDAILTPSAPSAAFPLGAKANDPIAMYLNDVFTVTANLAGVPAMSVPAGTDKDDLPLGLQIIAPALDEETMFKVGAVIEDSAGFNAKPEKWW
jgi:aspartyl-tRNA(Asn)/glutamyl-tRNA(Gln) amidotransferase subunit A